MEDQKEQKRTGYIYKLVNGNDDTDKIYVGSTINRLSKRYHQHKCHCNKETAKQYDFPVYQYIRANGGIEQWQIVLVEQFEYKTKLELNAREYYWQCELDTIKNGLNYISAPRFTVNETKQRMKQYYEANKEKIKQYRDTHKDQIKQQMMQYRDSHKDQIKDQKKQYYEANKEQILEKKKQYHNIHKEEHKNQMIQYYNTHKEQIKQYRNKIKLAGPYKCEHCDKQYSYRDSLTRHIKAKHINKPI